MKTVICSIVLCAFSVWNPLPAQSPRNARQAILEALERSRQAWNSRNLLGFMDAYHRCDSTLFVSSAEITRGWDAILDRYRRAFPDTAAMGKLTFDVLSLYVYGHTAVMTGRWTVFETSVAPRSGLFTLVWRRLEKNWKIVYDHTP